jgi:hypothetical protein
MAILSRGIKLSEFSTLPENELESRVNELFEEALNPAEKEVREWLDELDKQLCEFEQKYNLSSSTMKKLVDSGQMPADDEIHDWLKLWWERSYFEVRKSEASP